MAIPSIDAQPRQRVLIVDDDQHFSSIMAIFLEDLQYDVTRAHTVADGRKALLGETAPDLLFLDVMLPDGSGLELIEDVDPNAPTAIVVMTAQPSISTAVTALRSRVDDYLIKPLDMAKLRECLDRLGDAQGTAAEKVDAARSSSRGTSGLE